VKTRIRDNCDTAPPKRLLAAYLPPSCRIDMIADNFLDGFHHIPEHECRSCQSELFRGQICF
jgi:hypothetical protein